MIKRFFNKLYTLLKLLRALNSIRKSKLFDKAWYLEHYPDVAQARMDPVLHYLRFGGFEGRDPGPNFSSKWYLASYEDVKITGINPLLHYLRNGREEGRMTQYQRLITDTFYTALIRELLLDEGNLFLGSENWDETRFGANQPHLLPSKIVLSIEFDDIMNHLEGFAALYDLLADKESKTTVVKLVAYRILGYQKVKLQFASTHDIREIEKLGQTLIKSDKTIKIRFMDWILHHYDLSSIGYPIEGFFHNPRGFIINHYQYTKSMPVISAELGDVVIDGGACWGDTALYFANLVGESGKIYSFEFVPDNIEIMQMNLALNPHLAPRIEIIPLALFDASGEKLSYSANGPGTKLTNSKQDMSLAETVTIDNFVEKKSIDHIDFIKMDIEGAELNALRGAEYTMRKFRPKLAICLYHSLDDFTLISEFLNKLNLSYKFYVDHFSIHREETVLFAYPVEKVIRL